MAFRKDPRLQCSVCFSYLDSMQKVCCINSCLPFPDRIFNPNAQRFPIYNGIRAQPVKFSLKTYDLTPVVLPEQSAPKRAVETLPEILQFDVTKTSVSGASWIPVRSLFGPLVAPSKTRRSSSFARYAFKSGRYWKDFILDSDEECNWMKYVNSAENFEDQNVTAFRFDGSVYFAVTKDIQIGDELRIWYADSYAAELGKPFLSWISPVHENFPGNLEQNSVAELNVEEDQPIQDSRCRYEELDGFTEGMEFDEPEVESDPVFAKPGSCYREDSVGLPPDSQGDPDDIQEEPEVDAVFSKPDFDLILVDGDFDGMENLGRSPSMDSSNVRHSSFFETKVLVQAQVGPEVQENILAGADVLEDEKYSFDWICGKCAFATRSFREICKHSVLHSKVRPVGLQDGTSGLSKQLNELSAHELQRTGHSKIKNIELKNNILGSRVLRSSVRLRKCGPSSYKESGVGDEVSEPDAASNHSAGSIEEDGCDSDEEFGLNKEADMPSQSPETPELETIENDNSNNSLRCGQCGKDFKSRSRLKIHMEFKHGSSISKGFRRCVVCLQPVPRPDYPEHSAAHLDEDGKCPCPFCTKVLDSWHKANVHVRAYHYETLITTESESIAAKVVDYPKLFSCWFCSFVSAAEHSYKEHIKSHGMACYKCDICDLPHTTYENMRNHKFTEHNLEDNVIKPAEVSVSLSKRPKIPRCIYCDFTNPRLAVVANHALIHTEDGGFPCQICSRTSVNYKAAKAHARTHQPRNLKCKICGFTDYSQARLDDHIRTHSDPAFECPECGKMVRTQPALRFHRINHHGLKRLKQGVKTTAKQKNYIPKFENCFYKCMECTLGFVERNTFIEHLDSQHPEVSKLSFPELNLPMRNVDAFKCQYCPRVFITEEQSLEHQRKSHPETLVAANSEDEEDGGLKFTVKSRPKVISFEAHWCEMCETAFIRPKEFLKHVKIDHPDYHDVLMAPVPLPVS